MPLPSAALTFLVDELYEPFHHHQVGAAGSVNLNAIAIIPFDNTLQFFTIPGAGVAYDQVTLNDFRACYGRLLFKVNGGIQAGRWVFGIDLPESEIRIPFELGD